MIRTLSTIIAMLALLAGTTQAAVRTFSAAAAGPNGNEDSWNLAANWGGTLPSGIDSAVINAGLLADVHYDGTPDTPAGGTQTYSGGLTLMSNSTVRIGWMNFHASNVNALGTGTITMHTGSVLNLRDTNAFSLTNPVVLAGNATIFAADSTSDHNLVKSFTGGFSGSGLSLRGSNGQTLNLNVTNTMSSLDATADDRFRLFLNAAGAGGNGDVTMHKRAADGRGGSLVINSAAGTIADTATLTLNNVGYDGTTNDGAIPRAMVVMNENETVGALVINNPNAASLRLLSSDSTLTVNGAATFNGPSATLQLLNTSALTVGDLSFNDNNGWNLTGNTVTIDTSGGGSGTITANVDATISSVLAGTATITKAGNGTLLLTSAGNTHSGGIEIDAGTLALGASASISNSASIGIAPGGELDTTAQSFAMLGSQPFTFDIDPTGTGLAGLIDAASLDITAGNVSFNTLGALDDPFYVIANYTSLIGASFGSVLLPSGYALDYNYLGGNAIALVQQQNLEIPEPASIALWTILGLGLAGFARCRRRRNR